MAKMLQAETDPNFSDFDWTDFFQSSVMRVWRELIDLKQAFFCKRKIEIVHTAGGIFNLPDDFYEILWVEDPDGVAYYSRSLSKEREEGKVGWTLNEKTLVLVNETTIPSSLFIDYRYYPKEMGDWSSTSNNGDDPEADTTYELNYPLNNNRGLRLISNIIPVMAKVKDNSISESEFQLFLVEELKNFIPRYYVDMSQK